jgi:hypothetical protein
MRNMIEKATEKDEVKDVTDLINEWKVAKEWIDGYTQDFLDLDKLADGVALNHAKDAPVVGDVTLAGAVRQIPSNSIQQVPVFSMSVNGTKNSVKAYVCSFLLRDKVFNEDTFGKGILSTLQTGAESALTRGFQAFTIALGSSNADFGTSLKQVGYGDVAIEKGVFDWNESTIYFVRNRVTTGRLKKLIKNAKANPDTTWDVADLEELLKAGPNAEQDPRQDVSEPRDNYGQQSALSNQYDIITMYGTGAYYDVITFATNVNKPLRHFKSKSKFGYPRVQALVLDPTARSPFGVSRARLASPAANYANIYLQSTARMQLINADPPVIQRGQFTTPIQLKRRASWKTLDPQADARLVELSNSTLTEFRNVLDFVDQQILTVMGVSGVGTSASSRTYQNKESVQSQNEVKDISSTKVTNILENFLRQHGLGAIDLHISEQVGEEDLIVDDECKESINSLAESKFIPTPEMPMFVPPVGDDNIVHIKWEELYEGIKTWKVNVDLSMSKETLEAKKRADLQDAVTVASQTANPNDPVATQRKNMLEDKLFEAIDPSIQMSNSTQPAQPQMAPVGSAPAQPAPGQQG